MIEHETTMLLILLRNYLNSTGTTKCNKALRVTHMAHFAPIDKLLNINKAIYINSLDKKRP